MIPLKGKLSIHRSHGGARGDRVSILLEDESSRLRAIAVEVTFEAFGAAVTGLSAQPCEYDFNNSGLIGTVAENKTELVEFDGWRLREDPDAVNAALAPYEVYGWRADRGSQLFNAHLRHLVRPGTREPLEEKDGGTPHQRVTFRRYLRDGFPVELERKERES